ncbi:T9SS type A sorting domain-containing protein [Hymenobacter terrenus]|uniref:T9SS type A sorting domain-containing protein n=1 Tax=Hymenobacter terrenus TaxID=1629124 RepID=UPI0009E5896B|nr:T9SS type A sorting domain-containing protein [Hymenobacter terrenus]
MKKLIFTQKLFRQRPYLSYLFALLVSLGASHSALAQQTYLFSNVTITAKTTSSASSTTSVLYGKRNMVGQTAFNGAKLGGPVGAGAAIKFDPADGAVLTLDASSVQVSGFAANSITSSNLFYRVYLVGTSVGNQPSFSVLSLADQGNKSDFANAAAGINLLKQPAVLGGGDYVVEIYFATDYNDTFSGPSSVRDGGTNYIATFSVVAPAITPPGGSTTWISTSNNDWTVASNWSNGVPTRFSDAIIPEKNSSNTNTVTPALLDSDPNLYEVRSLTLNGTTNATRALLRIGQTTGAGPSGATLNVYGDLNTFGGGILAATSGTNGTPDPTTNSTIVLKGDNQVVRGLLAVVDFRVEGTGIKSVVNSITPSNTFVFAPGTSAIVRTVSETRDASTGNPIFTLNTTKTSNVDLKGSGVLLGETRTAYIEGVTLAQRNLSAGVMQKFGNIGIDITPNRDITGPPVEITRTVNDPLNGPTTASVNDPVNPSGGVAGAKPVRRQYGVSGDINNAPNVSTVVFHYLDSPSELNGIDEPDLLIFRTTNNGIPYNLVGGVVDVTNNTVTQTGVRSINTVTLGDRNKPLPVTLTSFDAKRVGADALITWQTASEINSKGYNVQVSADGKEFRTLGFVGSYLPNSSRPTSYSYTDVEKNKAGLRYYRLQQIDVDGKTAYFAPRTVSFDGKAPVSTAGLLAYPNPFSSDVRLSLQSSVEGQGLVLITDMMGRTIGQRQFALTAGDNDVALSNLSDLKSGSYLMKVSLPTGEVKTLKVVRQ